LAKKTNVPFGGCEVFLELLAFHSLAFHDAKLFFVLLCEEIPTNPPVMIFLSSGITRDGLLKN
jgi:hypothetical protein